MVILERNSHAIGARGPAGRHIRPGRVRHPSCEVLHRHRHDVAFAAVVIAGAYVEAGDTGLHRVSAGDVVLHRPYEAHLDRFDVGGAEVLTLELPRDFSGASVKRVADPDEIIRLAERDPIAAATALLEEHSTIATVPGDWPEQLAIDLLADPAFSIRAWAGRHGLHPGAIARGFRQHFGVTAAEFRSSVRAHRALRALLGTVRPLAEVAASAGFADQAHMTREITAITATTPGVLRRASVDLRARADRPRVRPCLR